ncbi:hypothetical protein PIB30_012280 [Stylosanthes scabra]|uniref:Uncharacterized protein n=1 Tax=Stylosanthes scabra TaxID=79078 RepID=A0ABU6X7K0_9FABA|nr:hypothetical protein [Stylosanthes scabra]
MCHEGWRMCLGDGKKTKLWEDSWIGDCPLKDKFPRLYRISCCIYDCGAWIGIRDKVTWTFGEEGAYSVKSFIQEANGRNFGTPTMKHTFDSV